MLQALAEPTRRRIVQMVWQEELTAGDIAANFDVTFGAVSQHLKVLRETGAVIVRHEGTKRYYLADKSKVGPLVSYLSEMWSTDLDRLAAAAERAERRKKA